ncbi:MAG: GAF domain-containing protein, partial [Rhodothermia bacterium]
ITLQFRTDEKKFDVEGASGVRFEMLKKRLDKAHVMGTDERITQPGKIAIVYSHEREAGEYRRFLQYLVANGYLDDSVEELQVEDLQGLSGLRMLRLTVSVGSSASESRTETNHQVS